ncbi:MAG: hypothetical protein IT406_04140 [Candidatus Yanofskybacteria bacterium]|nr:hypothetical protein [Candidatus Yanofskybacteria bacterium]
MRTEEGVRAAELGAIEGELVERMERHLCERVDANEVFSVPNGQAPAEVFRDAVAIVQRRKGVQAAVRTVGAGDFLAMFF